MHSSAPQRVAAMARGNLAVSAGGLHSCAIDGTGAVWCWGMNVFGQVGFPEAGPTDVPSPARVNGLTSGVVAIAAGGLHSCALTSARAVLCWGWAADGQLGNGLRAGPTDNAFNILVPFPVPVTGLESGVAAIAAGGHNSCAVTTAGAVLCWGLRSGSAVPVAVPTLSSGVKSIAVTSTHSCAVKVGGEVYCWGFNQSGQLGDGTTESNVTVPVRVPGLPAMDSVALGEFVAMSHSCGVSTTGDVYCWGRNWYGQLGIPTFGDFPAPIRVPGASGAARITAGGAFTCATMRDGTVLCWGYNEFNNEGNGGQLGDGTFVTRRKPALVLREQGAGSLAAGDWYLDLDPASPKADLEDKVPPLLAVGRQQASLTRFDTDVRLQIRAQDVGKPANTYVFALAPARIVQGAAEASQTFAMGKAWSGATPKVELPCVLAQLTSSGQLRAVSPSALQAYATGVLQSQIDAVTILNGVPTVNIEGAVFYVGYGTSADAMLSGGTNRSVTAAGSQDECRPRAPETGWWWNPAEGGRGYSIEARGNNMFFAAFHYDVSGRSTWHVASGPTSLDGALYIGDLLSASGGQTLGGAYPGFPRIASIGALTLTFHNARAGTLVWPGGVVPIERFNIVPNGLAAAPKANQPETGWWWNPEESGRGFFMEWQNGTLDLAGYMYDEQGNPVWYLALYETPDIQAMSGNWWSYRGGQTMTGPYREPDPPNQNVAPVTITFSGPDTALMTLPNGRTTSLRRHGF